MASWLPSPGKHAASSAGRMARPATTFPPRAIACLREYRVTSVMGVSCWSDSELRRANIPVLMGSGQWAPSSMAASFGRHRYRDGRVHRVARGPNSSLNPLARLRSPVSEARGAGGHRRLCTGRRSDGRPVRWCQIAGVPSRARRSSCRRERRGAGRSPRHRGVRRRRRPRSSPRRSQSHGPSRPPRRSGTASLRPSRVRPSLLDGTASGPREE